MGSIHVWLSWVQHIVFDYNGFNMCLIVLGLTHVWLSCVMKMCGCHGLCTCLATMDSTSLWLWWVVDIFECRGARVWPSWGSARVCSRQCAPRAAPSRMPSWASRRCPCQPTARRTTVRVSWYVPYIQVTAGRLRNWVRHDTTRHLQASDPSTTNPLRNKRVSHTSVISWSNISRLIYK